MKINEKTLGGILVLIGTFLYILATIFHGNPPIEKASTAIPFVAEQTFWQTKHFINIIAILLWLFGFICIFFNLSRQSSRLMAKIALTQFTITTTIFAIYFYIHGFGLTQIANKWQNAPSTEKQNILLQGDAILNILGTTAFISQLFLGISIILIALVFIFEKNVNKTYTIIGIIIGLGWAIEAYLINFAIIVPFTLLSWVWLILLIINIMKNQKNDLKQK